MKRIAGLTFSLIVVSLIINFLTTRPKLARAQTGASLATQLSQLKAAGLVQVGDRLQSITHIQELQTIFATTVAAVESVAPGPDAGARKRAIDNQLRQELDSFATNNPASAWTPGLNILLGRRDVLRCAYSSALAHYAAAVQSLEGSTDPTARALLREASGGLARLLVLTGHLAEFDQLNSKMVQLGILAMNVEWRAAREMREWARKHPEESYKCGLYCLDQLGRLTQQGHFVPKEVTENPSSLDGFTAADLLNVASKAGLRVHAALLRQADTLPVPCVLHLRSEHFVFVREQRGSFYEIFDPAAPGPRWLTAEDLSSEITGCVIVSDASALQTSAQLTEMDPTLAASYRGRCHGPTILDHDDNPCDGECCPPGGPGSNSNRNNSNRNNQKNDLNQLLSTGGNPRTFGNPRLGNPNGGCSLCGGGGGFLGMTSWFVSEPFVNLWFTDTPMTYDPAYGPLIDLRLKYLDRHFGSIVSGRYWQGARLGNGNMDDGVWSCSWLSYAELSHDEYTVDLMCPSGGWATFTFSAGSNQSSMNFRNNCWLEKQGPTGGVTNLVLHYPDGSQSSYGLGNQWTSATGGIGNIYYRSTFSDPTGLHTTFAYDSNYYLTNVTAADGTSFSLHYENANVADLITSVTSSYGVTVTFSYSGTFSGDTGLTSITDAAGINSQLVYLFGAYEGPVTDLITPYGTTQFSIMGKGGDGDYGIFDRVIQITNSNGSQEFYAMLNQYTNNNWPIFRPEQIPTNTPLGTLDADSGERHERNTFYWNPQQFEELAGTDPFNADWPQFKLGRIQHWLATTSPSYSHFDTLSIQQEPSPDGGLTEGQLTWYDYTNKPAGVDYEDGSQIMPSVVARVMPDGSTWFDYIQRLTNGLPTEAVETWVDGATTISRTNTFVYAANNTDMVGWTNALGILAETNIFNSYHQVRTNYDALGQMTIYTYDPNTFHLTSVSAPSGLTTTNLYGSDHRLLSTIDLQINRTNTFTWSADGTLATKTDPRNLTISYFWDGLHRETGSLFPDGTTTSNRYDIISGVPYPNSTGGTMLLDLTATKDRLGYWTYFAYDALRREIYETNANNVVTAYGYCDCGAVSSKTNALGTTVEQSTVYLLDDQANLIATLNADGYNVTNTYDALGRKTMTTDGWKTNWFNYDNVGLLTSISNACGVEQSSTFDLLDRTVYLTDANGVTITNSYDALNRVLMRGYPDGGVEKFGYSARGLTAYTNQLTFATLYAYDAGGRKTFETNANSQLLTYTNSPAGDLLSLTDGNSQTTRWNYDVYGQVTNKIVQGGTVILTYAYDPDDRLTNRWSAAKGTTSYYYDPVGNLTNITYPVNPAVSFSYDPLNRVTNMVDGLGTNNYTYTLGDQLLTDDGPFANDTITNTYVNRLRTNFTVPTWSSPASSWTNLFSYDKADRFSTVTSPGGTFQYLYPASASRLSSRTTLPDSAYITNIYDINARLTTTALKTSGSTTLESASYGYNRGNQRTNFLNAGGTNVTFTYDNIGQLVSATSTSTSEGRGYLYDPGWNVITVTNINGPTFVFNMQSLNEISWDSSGNYTYDLNGNLTSTASGLTNYCYDDENRLVSWVYSAGSIASPAPSAPSPACGANPGSGSDLKSAFFYDGLGRLRKRIDYISTGAGDWFWQPVAEARYIYDGMRVVQERDGNNNPTAALTRGSDLSGTLEGAGGIRGLLAISVGAGLSQTAYYHADGNGNITALETAQSVVGTYRYDPFGNTISKTGQWADTNAFRFSSKEIHPNSGMYYYGFRFYAPDLDRWINRDPLGEAGDINLYRFSRNRPPNVIDPFGLQDPETPGGWGPRPFVPEPVGPMGKSWDIANYEPGHYEPKPEEPNEGPKLPPSSHQFNPTPECYGLWSADPPRIPSGDPRNPLPDITGPVRSPSTTSSLLLQPAPQPPNPAAECSNCSENAPIMNIR